MQGTCKRERNGDFWEMKGEQAQKSPVSAGSRAGTAGGRRSDGDGRGLCTGRGGCSPTRCAAAALDLMQIEKIEQSSMYVRQGGGVSVGRHSAVGRSVGNTIRVYCWHWLARVVGGSHCCGSDANDLAAERPAGMDRGGAAELSVHGMLEASHGVGSVCCGGLFSPPPKQAAGQAQGLTACSWAQ